MRRACLILMEQVLMLLVFAVAAAFCVQAFALSRDMSLEAAGLDSALAEAQNAAELLKSSGGTAGEGLDLLGSVLGGRQADGRWQTAAGSCTLEAAVEAGCTVETVTIRCLDSEGEVLFSLPVAWQAGEHHG